MNNASLNSYSGFVDYEYGWNRGLPFRVFFCASFDTPFSATSGGLFTYPYDATQQTPISKPHLKSFNGTLSVNGSAKVGIGALFTWKNLSISTVESRIGISFISEQKACNFLEIEAPAAQPFNDTISKARKLWNGKATIDPDDGS